MYSASTTVTSASSVRFLRSTSSSMKDWMTGAGSARPVVSMMKRSMLRPGLEDTRDGADQVAAHRAADTAIAELDHRLVGRVHQLAVDADLAELIDDDRDLLAGTLLQEVVEQCRLAGAEKSREDGRWNLAHGAGPEATGTTAAPGRAAA